MDILPYELNLKIFEHLLPDNSCDIKEFQNYFLINKYWNTIFNSYQMRQLFLNTILKDNDPILKDTKYLSIPIDYGVQFSYNNLFKHHCYNNILCTYNQILVDIIGYYNLIHLPVCKFKNSKCIDNICFDKQCCFSNHSIDKYITSSLMRGIDDLGRHYLLFVYTDTETDELYYEFIYNKITNNDVITTYSGMYNNTFIGMLSDNTHFPSINGRELNTLSYKYIEKLLKREKCCIPKYNNYYDIYLETNLGNIELW
tara:strand:+ start:1755 stop:2522 length:768 start_codon:yes stop_codon:yes gene_type:complete